MLRTVALLSLGLLFPLSMGATFLVDMTPEIEEGLGDLYQKTCVQQAQEMEPDPSCPWRSYLYPPGEGIEILDSYATFAIGPPSLTSSTLRISRGDPKATDEWNTRRETGGLLPDMIPPGPVQFVAWYGLWKNLDRDRTLRAETPGGVVQGGPFGSTPVSPQNEWTSRSMGGLGIAGYVSPGVHPDWIVFERPGEFDPDFWYARSLSSGYLYYHIRLQNGGFVLFLDGTLLQEYRVDSISDPILVPSPEGMPYTLRPESLLDVDLYEALAPTPLSEIYGGTLGPTVNAVGSPSLGSCPSGCRPGPLPPSDLPPPLEPLREEPLRDVLLLPGRLYAPQPREWDEREESSSSGKLDLFQERYAGYAALIPRWTPTLAMHSELAYLMRPGPLPGKTEEGAQAALAGFLSFELWTGVWKDLNGDGFVGRADPNDPYEGGTRPIPDRYSDSGGEFFGIFADKGTYATIRSLNVTLVPDPDWGAGVVVYDSTRGIPSGRIAVVQGTTPIFLPLTRDVVGSSAGDDIVKGHYRSDFLLLPFGTLTFSLKACTDVVQVSYTDEGVSYVDPVFSCRKIGRLSLGETFQAG